MPNPLTPIFIEGNGPAGAGSAVASGAGGGIDDFLGLAFADVANPVFTPGSTGEGAYGFDNAAFLYYSGMESTAIDDVAPYVVAQSYDESAVPTIYVEFSEDVSNALSVYDLELINTTTSEQIPFANVELAYDAATNTASFTFPGYPDGILPPGDYTAMIYGSLPDLFGNQLGTETPLSFTVATVPPTLPGDYNQNGEVDAADYIVWRKTLGATGLPVYSGADGDGDGDITQADYNVWRSHFGETLPLPGAGSMMPTAAAIEQPSTVTSGTDTFVSIERVSQLSEAAGQTPTETISTPVKPDMENTAAAALAMLDSHFARHDSASGPREWIHPVRVAESAHDNLLFLLANDRVVRCSRRANSVVDDLASDGHRGDDLRSQSPIDEPLAVALMEWR